MDERSERIERHLEPFMLVAALLVVPVLVIEGSSFGEPWDTAGTVLNWTIWLAFVGELALILAIVPQKGRWLRDHPLEVLIVVATPPFVASAFAGLRILRLLRVLRLFRLAKIARRVFSVEGLRYAAMLALLAALGGGAAYASVESDRTIGDGLYWSLTTMTTVGYGGSPSTTTGKVLAVAVTLVGISFVATLTGAIAERFLAGQVEEEVAGVEDEIELAEEQVLAEIRDLAVRLQRLESRLRAQRAMP